MSLEKKFTLIQGEGETSKEEKENELQKLVIAHACGTSDRPLWCVYNKNNIHGIGVLYWIHHTKSEEFVARKIASLVSELGGDAVAEKTEWNETLKGAPVYKARIHYDRIENIERDY